MARLRDSRSPSPAGSYTARRRKDDERRDRRSDRDRRRSRSPLNRYRDRGHDRDRSRDRETSYRRRDRSIDRRDDGYGGNRRDRRWSRDRASKRAGLDIARSPGRYTSRDRGDNKDHRNQREDSRDRARGHRQGTAEFDPRRGTDGRSRQKDGPSESAKSTPSKAQSEAEKKAERLRKLQAMKEKKAKAAQEVKEPEVTPDTTRQLLAELDRKSSGAKIPAAVPPPSSSRVLAAGRFDSKSVVQKSKRGQSPVRLGGITLGSAKNVPSSTVAATAKATAKAIASPAGGILMNKAMSKFGFQKEADSKVTAPKRKLDLGEEDTVKLKLQKLDDAAVDDTPYLDEDVEDENPPDDEAKDAELLRERRDAQMEESAIDVDVVQEAAAAIQPESKSNGPVPTQPEAMSVEDGADDDVDPLDAFMAGLENDKSSKNAPRKGQNIGTEPEAYFSDDGPDVSSNNPSAASILALAAKKKKKDIPTLDYSRLDLKPAVKNLWVEPQELNELSDAELADLRYTMDGIKVQGKDVPKPVQKWSHCGLTRPILDTIESVLRWTTPTPIQMQALPVLMSGRDVIGVAKTGSGKTGAFVIPMMRHIMAQNSPDGNGPIAVIQTPTRELATQIYSDCLPFAKALALRVVAAYGGTPIKDQIAQLKSPVDIVIATPGRFIDLLAANGGRVVDLKRTTYMVLDEADRMFDMGFEPQVMKVFGASRDDRQTVLFSATMPRIIDALTKKVLKNPIEITVGGRSIVAKEIEQKVLLVPEEEKFARTLELLGELYADDGDVRCLIFVERQEKCDDLLRELLRRGYGCMSIHGGKDQEDRSDAIADFKRGVSPVLIATSVAARGLDIKELKCVINFDAPNHLEDYVHRAGRTGRAGNTGTAVTFITGEQESCAPGIAKALEQSSQVLPDWLKDMAKSWKTKVKSGAVKIQSGFGGKGLERLDKDREAARLRERKTHKAEGDDNDEDAVNKKDEEKTDKAKSAASAVVSRDAPTDAPTASAAKPVIGSGKGGAVDKAALAIADINARLARAGALRTGQPIDNKGPDAGAFHATLEINDFPQKARWSVTNRSNVSKILDATGVSITTKGNFYPPGKAKDPNGEPPLYILIEGDTEVQVQNALGELTRLLKEGTIAAAESESRAPASGRYTIT